MTVDLSAVPLVALSSESKQVISTLLNPPKVLPSDNGLPRDWRGLAHLCNLSGEVMPLLTTHPDPSAYILTAWEQKQKTITLKDFQAALEEIDRWDILCDALEHFERDAERYLDQLQKSRTSAETLENDTDEKVLTVGDLHRQRQGLENQYYDAFLLYADDDIKFATEMVDKLEGQYNLKLCLKDRDLIGGITFEHEAVMTLISERCNRLIVIVSSNFLKSPENKFFLNYAQALGIEKRQRKIVPCLYEKCRLPPQLSYMFILDYNRVGLYDFWAKLRDSVQAPNKVQENLTNCPAREDRPNNLETKVETNKFNENTKHLESSDTEQLQERKDNKAQFNSEPKSVPGETKDNKKKYNHFLKWTKKKLCKKEYSSITETVSLPSLASLDTLPSTESMEKKNKTEFVDKYVKKAQLKKVLDKS